MSSATIELDRPLVGSEVKCLHQNDNALLEKADRERAAQAITPGAAEARLPCYAEIQRLADGAIDSMLRQHPWLSARRIPR